MAIEVRLKVEQISKWVYEIRTIVKGKFYSRRYMGYTRKQAIKLFEKWIGTKI